MAFLTTLLDFRSSMQAPKYAWYIAVLVVVILLTSSSVLGLMPVQPRQLLLAENATERLVPPVITPAYVTVKTDKQVYYEGETIIISGKVMEVQVGMPVLIQVYDPTEALYRSVQVNVSTDGSYGYALRIEDSHGFSGEYSVKATYELNYPSNSAEVSFLYLIPYNLTIGDKTYPINYTISDGKLDKITANIEEKSLSVMVNATGPGDLTITLPRSVIDAVQNNLDAAFTVFIDHRHEQFDFHEIQTNANARTLVIFLTFVEKPSMLDIKIVGTKIVPEFPISITHIVGASVVIFLLLYRMKFGVIHA